MEITVELETVTPLFSGGAEPRGEPELRAAPFKGALRFWWRALRGSVVTNLNELAADEEKTFGSTENASPIVLRLSHGDEQPPKPWQFNQFPGVDYLFFSLKGNRQDPDRKGFIAGQKFALTLQTRLGINSEKAFRETCAALWLLVRLGGIGARSRRGVGCLKVTNTSDDWPKDFPSLHVHATSPNELKDEIQSGLKALYDALSWQGLTTAAMKNYDILHRDLAKLSLLDKKWESWPEALDEVGRAYRQFRSRRQPDYDNVKAVVGGRSTKLSPVERAAFGLPIVFYYRSLGGQRGMLEGREASRRASPLMFHVTQLANPKYVVELIHFKAPLLPRDSGLMLRPRGRPAFANAPPREDNLIDKFLRSIGQQGHQDQQGNLFIAPTLEVKL